MSEKSWPWSTVAALGDGASELNEALSREFLSLFFGVQNPAVEGVCKGLSIGELEVTGIATPLSVDPGAGICYGLYINDAVKTLAITTPAVGTTGGRVVLQTNWAGTGGAGLEARTRLAVKYSADGNPAIPALTQAFGITWEVSLATFTVTTGGVITVTDDRTFRRSTAMVDTDEIIDQAITSVKIENGTIQNIDIADGQINANKLANDAVTSGKIGANAVIAGKLANGAVDTTARIADGIVTADKIANRTRKFIVEIIPGSGTYDIRGLGMADGSARYGYGCFHCPQDYVSGLTVKAIIIPDASGNICYTSTADYGAVGENWFTHSENHPFDIAAVIINQHNLVGTLSLVSLAVGDIVHLAFEREGADPSDTLSAPAYCSGWLVEYTADS
jgi:hypothetical protein